MKGWLMTLSGTSGDCHPLFLARDGHEGSRGKAEARSEGILKMEFSRAQSLELRFITSPRTIG